MFPNAVRVVIRCRATVSVLESAVARWVTMEINATNVSPCQAVKMVIVILVSNVFAMKVGMDYFALNRFADTTVTQLAATVTSPEIVDADSAGRDQLVETVKFFLVAKMDSALKH